jgi:hypothetical protein
MGIDGRIYPVRAAPKARDAHTAELDFMDEWHPIQVKQMDRVGRPDIDKFEAAMMRRRRKKGFFVGFDFSRDALTEIDAFPRREHIGIIPLAGFGGLGMENSPAFCVATVQAGMDSYSPSIAYPFRNTSSETRYGCIPFFRNSFHWAHGGGQLSRYIPAPDLLN